MSFQANVILYPIDKGVETAQNSGGNSTPKILIQNFFLNHFTQYTYY
jgi:hypothetical protein